MAEEVFIPPHLQHQTHCFRHKQKLEVFEDSLCGVKYVECPECHKEMEKDLEEYLCPF